MHSTQGNGPFLDSQRSSADWRMTRNKSLSHFMKGVKKFVSNAVETHRTANFQLYVTVLVF